METLHERFIRKMEGVSLSFTRSLMGDIHWDARLIGIKGSRGVGKTTLLLQHIKKSLPINEKVLYVSLDNIWFSENKLVDLADQFVKRGGEYLFLDEVHKYPNWSQEIKNIYDDYSNLKIVFTGSSLLEILNARADLSRRAIVYTMQGLSYREFLAIKVGVTVPVYSLEQIMKNHLEISKEINAQLRPLQYFDAYLKIGYYPFFTEMEALYHARIEEIVNMILEIELPLLRKVEVSYVSKIKQLLQIISSSVPFIPNITKLSERIGVNRSTFVTYMYFLEEAGVTINLFKDADGISRLQKPDKIYLENTNLMQAFSGRNVNVGATRETFFLNQIGYKNKVDYTAKGDFLVNKKYTFEVGGISKNEQQIKSLKNAFVAADNIEYGMGNKIPLWLFGCMY
jgi:predicted AAA+ superfamily ATPase